MTETMKDSGQEWIGAIPESWDTNRIRYCLDEINVKNSPVKTEQILSLVKDKGVMLYEEKGDVGNKAKEDITGYKVAFPNTLIVNSMNILIGSVGISKYKGCVSPVYYVFREKDNSDLRFVNYIFNTREFQKELRKYANGILEIRLRISATDIFNRKIPLPPKEEQIKIADFLDEKCTEIDKLSEDIQKQIDILEEYKKSVITRAVTKGLNPDVEMKDSGDERLGMIPANWDAKKLKFVTREIYENGLMVPENDRYIGMENVLSYSNDFHEANTEYEISFQKKCKKGIVLFGKLRPYLAKVIICPFTGFATGEFMQLSNFDGDSRYLRYSLLNRTFIESVNMSTYGAKMPRANSEYVNNLKICIPPKDEQCKIADFLDNVCQKIDESIRLQQKQLSHLDTYKRSIIYEYVTGKKRVKGAL